MRTLLALVALIGAVACRPGASKIPTWVQGIPEVAVTSVSGEAGFFLDNKALQSALTQSPLAEQMLDLFIQKARIDTRTETGRITLHVLNIPKVGEGGKGLEKLGSSFLIQLTEFRDPKALLAAVTESFPAEGFLRVGTQDWPMFIVLDLQQGPTQVHLRVVSDPQGGLWLGDLSALASLGGKTLAQRPGVAAAAQWLSPRMKLQGAVRPDPILGGLRDQIPAEWARELPEGIDTILWGAGPLADGQTWTFELVVGGETAGISRITPWLQRLGAALDAVRTPQQPPIQILQEGRRAGLKATLDSAQLQGALGKLGLPQIQLDGPKGGARTPRVPRT